MKLNALILDDEAVGRNVLRNMIATFLPNINLVGEAANIGQAWRAIIDRKPQIVFMDVELNSENGLDLMRKFDSVNFQVVIVSGYERYAIDSYDFEVTDYLLKPLVPSHLKRACNRVQERILLKQNAEKAAMQKTHKEEIKLPFGSSYRYIPIINLVRVEANRNYSWIHLKNGHSFLISKTLGLVEKMMEPFQFMRIHHSHLINPEYINSFERAEERIKMHDGTLLPISRERKKNLVEYFDRLRS
jgi:two-component system LytT family response regulator